MALLQTIGTLVMISVMESTLLSNKYMMIALSALLSQSSKATMEPSSPMDRLDVARVTP